MTIASQTSRISYTGDGSTTAFAVPFYFQANADLVVYLTDTLGNATLQVLGTNYNLTGQTVSTGGTCTFVTAPTTSYLVSIYRDPQITQTTSYNNNDPFPAKSHELALDKLTTIDQRTRDVATRSLHISDSESASTVTTLASVATRKNKLLGFDSTGAVIYPLGPTFVSGTAVGVANVDTRATAAVTTFAAGINAVVTSGQVTAGDGLGQTYIRGTAGGLGAFQDAGGVYWNIGTVDIGAVPTYETVALATAATIPTSALTIKINRYATGYPLAPATYIPGTISGPMAFQEAGGHYWQLDVTGSALSADWFGAKGDGVANDATALQAALTAAAGKTLNINSKTYDIRNSSLTVSDNTVVVCGSSTVIRRSTDIAGATPYSDYTKALLSMGNYCRWSGGTLTNTAVLATSTSSNTMGSGGTKSFTVATGLTLTSSISFLRIYSRANGANHFEGTVNSYNSGTGALVLNAQFSAGSGTFTDWNICHGAVYQCAVALHATTNTLVENVRITGNWYVGAIMDGWNPNPLVTGLLTVSRCTMRNCYAESCFNRGFYLYGNTADVTFDTCFAVGGAGITDYGFNYNPANPTGSINAQVRSKTINCSSADCGFQGYGVGDLCYYNLIQNCTASGITSGVGFLLNVANGGSPQYCQIKDCVANNCFTVGFQFAGNVYGGASGCSAVACGQGYLIGPSAGVQAQFVSIDSSEAVGCTTVGFEVVGNSNRCDLNDIKAAGNTTIGVLLDAGAVRTLVTGRSINNTSANLTDSGTSSVTTGLTVA